MSNKMTRQRKWLLGVLGLGVAAVVVDRAMLGGPEAANASDGPASASDAAVEPVSSSPAPADSGEAAPAGSAPIDLSDFAERLDQLSAVVDLAHASERSDAFTAPTDWETPPLVVEQAATEPVVADGSLVRAFQETYSHNGTMIIDGVEYVILNGHRKTSSQVVERFVLRIARGQVVAGFVLHDFNGLSSVWEHTQTHEEVRLLLPGITSP